MRIAVVHSYYSNRQPSGENVVVDLQVGALRRAGHEVHVVARAADPVQAVLQPVHDRRQPPDGGASVRRG